MANPLKSDQFGSPEGYTVTPIQRRRRYSLALTDALNKKGDPAELAGLIIKFAKQGDSVALRLWAQYIQSPETVTRVLDEADSAVGYEQITDEQLDQAIEVLEYELFNGPQGERSPVPETQVSEVTPTLPPPAYPLLSEGGPSSGELVRSPTPKRRRGRPRKSERRDSQAAGHFNSTAPLEIKSS